MNEVHAVKLINGDEFIAEFVGEDVNGESAYTHPIIVIMNPENGNVQFFPYFSCSNLQVEGDFIVKKDKMMFDPQKVFPPILEQYTKIFSKIITPESAIITPS